MENKDIRKVELLGNMAATIFAGLDTALGSQGQDAEEEDKVDYSVKSAVMILDSLLGKTAEKEGKDV